jgi:hypothetical protein
LRSDRSFCLQTNRSEFGVKYFCFLKIWLALTTLIKLKSILSFWTYLCYWVTTLSISYNYLLNDECALSFSLECCLCTALQFQFELFIGFLKLVFNPYIFKSTCYRLYSSCSSWTLSNTSCFSYVFFWGCIFWLILSSF